MKIGGVLPTVMHNKVVVRTLVRCLGLVDWVLQLNFIPIRQFQCAMVTLMLPSVLFLRLCLVLLFVRYIMTLTSRLILWSPRIILAPESCRLSMECLVMPASDDDGF